MGSSVAPVSQRAPYSVRGSQEVDVVVIGGGVNGAGVARDASMRGLSVALFERNDFAFGASGNSSGMIHGGPRYLSYDPAVTETSCRDSGHIQAIAPHLLFRIPFLMPVEKSSRAKVLFTLMDAFFHAYDDYQPLKHGKPHARLTQVERIPLGPVDRIRHRDDLDPSPQLVERRRLYVASALAKRAKRLLHLGLAMALSPNGPELTCRAVRGGLKTFSHSSKGSHS